MPNYGDFLADFPHAPYTGAVGADEEVEKDLQSEEIMR